MWARKENYRSPLWIPEVYLFATKGNNHTNLISVWINPWNPNTSNSPQQHEAEGFHASTTFLSYSGAECGDLDHFVQDLLWFRISVMEPVTSYKMAEEILRNTASLPVLVQVLIFSAGTIYLPVKLYVFPAANIKALTNSGNDELRIYVSVDTDHLNQCCFVVSWFLWKPSAVKF